MCGRKYDIPEGYLAIGDIATILNVSSSFVSKNIIIDMHTENYGKAKLIKIEDFIKEFKNLEDNVEEYINSAETQCLSCKNIAQILGVSETTVSRMLKDKELDAFFINKSNNTLFRVRKQDFLKRYPEYVSKMYRVLYNLIDDSEEDIPVVDIKRKCKIKQDESEDTIAELKSNDNDVVFTEEENQIKHESVLEHFEGDTFAVIPISSNDELSEELKDDCSLDGYSLEDYKSLCGDIYTTIHDLTDETNKFNAIYNRFCEITNLPIIVNSCTKNKNLERFTVRKTDKFGNEYEIVEFVDLGRHKITATKYYIIGGVEYEGNRMLVCTITYDSDHRISSKTKFFESARKPDNPALRYSEVYSYHFDGGLHKRIRLSGESIVTQVYDEKGYLEDMHAELFINDMDPYVRIGYNNLV